VDFKNAVRDSVKVRLGCVLGVRVNRIYNSNTDVCTLMYVSLAIGQVYNINMTNLYKRQNFLISITTSKKAQNGENGYFDFGQ
jgi:hypothetical protein